MAATNGRRGRLIAERARALAIVCLTRRPDVVVEDVKHDDIGLDLIARIVQEDKPGLRQLGVELKGVWHSVTREDAETELRPALQQIARYGPFPFPVCLFFFTMQDDRGWFSWVAEPQVRQDGGFQLLRHERPFCKPLDDNLVDEIVDQVDRWYDAFYGSLVAEEPQGKPRR